MSLSAELPGPALAAGLAVLASASWPGTRADGLPAVAGFVTSGFSPLVAAVADLCLTRYFGEPPAAPEYGARTALVLTSTTGDLVTSAAIAEAVQAGRRVPPLLFYQSNHNAVAGYVAARWELRGPMACTMPCGSAGAAALDQAMTDGAASAALLVADGDADAALVIAANCYLDGTVCGEAMILGPASWPSRHGRGPAALKGMR
ncbi:MAG TPA: beta-ketoacyl synthase chain length factor [Streptosporangiaceae bacterium]|nr:beta-ketoacyl synthase chain length factor [Streptosporangiaceae bacterium]